MKSIFKGKIFRNIILLFSTAVLAVTGVIFTSCEYYNLPVKAVLYEYGTLPFIETTKVSGNVVMDSSGYMCVPSQEACSVNFILNNPKSKHVQMELSFPESSVITKDDYEFEVASDEKSALLTFSEDFLAQIDGDTKKFNITPALKLYYINHSVSQIIKIDSKTVRLRCNTRPDGVTNGCSMMYSDLQNSISNRLVVCFDLPDNETDVTKLTVGSRTYTISGSSFEEQSVNGWILTGSAPAGLTATESSGSGFSSAGKACYVITDVDNVNSKGKFNIAIKLTDDGGLSSPSFIIPSRELALDEVIFANSSGDTELSGKVVLSQLKGKDYAEILVKAPAADPDAVVYCTVLQNGNIYDEVHNAGTVRLKLYPALDGSSLSYEIYANAVKTGYTTSLQSLLEVDVKSEPVTYSIYEVSSDLTENEISNGGAIEISNGDYATVRIKASVSGTVSHRVYTAGTSTEADFTETDTEKLYPNIDGTQKLYSYTITGTKEYHTVTEKTGSLSITGRTLGEITSNTTDGKLVPGDDGAEYKLTATEEGAALTYSVTDAAGAPVSDSSGKQLVNVKQENISKNPVVITLGSGKYNVNATLTKDYCRESTFEQELTVTASAVWISQDGADTNAGTKNSPFKTLSKAYEVLAASGDNSSNVIYIKSDLAPDQGFNDSSKPITAVICGAKNGTIGSPVTIDLSGISLYTNGAPDLNQNASGFNLGSSQNIIMKNIIFKTTSSTSANPARLYAAVMCQNSGSSITLEDCTFSGIYARGGVSAIAVENGTVNLINTFITGNYAKPESAADKGKAVSVTQNGILTLSGIVKITDNKGLSDSGVTEAAGNLFLGDNCIAEIQEDFEAASKIGISTDKDEASLPVTITSGYRGNPSGTFTSDDGYKVKTVSSGDVIGELQLSNDSDTEGGLTAGIIRKVRLSVYSELDSETTASNSITLSSATSSSDVLKYKIHAVEITDSDTIDITSSLENVSINVTPGGSETGIAVGTDADISIPKSIIPGTYQILISAEYLDDTYSETVMLTVN